MHDTYLSLSFNTDKHEGFDSFIADEFVFLLEELDPYKAYPYLPEDECFRRTIEEAIQQRPFDKMNHVNILLKHVQERNFKEAFWDCLAKTSQLFILKKWNIYSGMGRYMPVMAYSQKHFQLKENHNILNEDD